MPTLASMDHIVSHMMSCHSYALFLSAWVLRSSQFHNIKGHLSWSFSCDWKGLLIFVSIEYVPKPYVPIGRKYVNVCMNSFLKTVFSITIVHDSHNPVILNSTWNSNNFWNIKHRNWSSGSHRDSKLKIPDRLRSEK